MSLHLDLGRAMLGAARLQSGSAWVSAPENPSHCIDALLGCFTRSSHNRNGQPTSNKSWLIGKEMRWYPIRARRIGANPEKSDLVPC